MAVAFLTAVDFAKVPALNFVAPVVTSDPAATAADEGRIIYNTTSNTVKYSDGTQWIELGSAGAGGPPSGAAGGDLTGNYPTPQIATGVIVDADVNASANIAQSKISGLAASLTAKQDTSQKGTANGYAPLDANSLVPTAHMPPLAINEIFTVASQAAMLALSAQRGDMAIRTDNGLTYVLATDDPTQAANWKTVTAAGAVTSVNGATGVVNITLASLSGVPTTTQVLAGNGMTGGGALSGNVTLNLVGDANLNVAADQVSVLSAPKWTTPRSITLTGDVTGSVASVDGSANVSIATTVASAGTAPKHYAGDVGAGTAVIVNHALNTRDVTVQVYRATTPWDTILCDVERTDVNNVTLRFASAVGASAYRVVVQGR